MSINKTYAVFGLGRYGTSVAKELVANGAEVIAVDIDESRINDLITTVPVCKCADITDPEVISRLGISNVDTVIISMATNLEASVMATILCKEAGVPNVIVKCGSEINRRILTKVGADKVILPESESGVRLAKNLLSSGFVDIIELSKGISMVELEVKDSWTGKSLIDLDLRKKYDINVVAIKHGDSLSVSVDPKLPLSKDMKLVVIADTSKLSKLK